MREGEEEGVSVTNRYGEDAKSFPWFFGESVLGASVLRKLFLTFLKAKSSLSLRRLRKGLVKRRISKAQLDRNSSLQFHESG